MVNLKFPIIMLLGFVKIHWKRVVDPIINILLMVIRINIYYLGRGSDRATDDQAIKIENLLEKILSRSTESARY